MLMIAGFDKGSMYTKKDDDFCIRSTVREINETDFKLNANQTILEHQGKAYEIGKKGSYATDLQKSEHLNTKLLILTAIANAAKDTNVTVKGVTGLPIAQFKAQRDKMKAMLNGTHRIKLNGIEHVIKAEFAVFPEGAGAFYAQSEPKSMLIIDIGGLSIDIAHFENEDMIEHDTYQMGIMKLYNKIASRINAKYDLSQNEWDVERILRDGLYIDGEQAALQIEDIINEYVIEVVERLMLRFDTKVIKNIMLAGGSAEWLHGWFKKYIPQLSTIANPLYGNAIGYRNIARRLYR